MSLTVTSIVSIILVTSMVVNSSSLPIEGTRLNRIIMLQNNPYYLFSSYICLRRNVPDTSAPIV